MATQRFYAGNAKQTTLQVAMSPFSTTIVLNSITGLPTSFPFVLKLDAGTAVEEKVLATASAGGTSYSVQRGFDGTFAGSHSVGATATHVWAALDASDFSGHIFATTEDDHTQYLRKADTRQVQSFTNFVIVSQNSGTLVPLQSVTIPPKTLKANSRLKVSTVFAGSTATTFQVQLAGQQLFLEKFILGGTAAHVALDLVFSTGGSNAAFDATIAAVSLAALGDFRNSPFTVDTTSSVVLQFQGEDPSQSFSQLWTTASVIGV